MRCRYLHKKMPFKSLFISRIDRQECQDKIYDSPPELEEYTLFTISIVEPYDISPIYKDIPKERIE